MMTTNKVWWSIILSHSQIRCQHPANENIAPRHIFGHDPACSFAAISVVFDDATCGKQSPGCWRISHLQ